jgi:3-hydroxyisobutyrate dehydrogenase-like beta-hydroxyacid dehydrogenase
MGGGIATRIIQAGYPTVVWARRPEALAEFDVPNVTVASSPAALGADADLIGICVWSDDDVRAVVTGDDGVLAGCRPGSIIVIHSTTLPSTCRALADLAAPKGVFVVDAPVTGGRAVALAGALTVAAGGDETAFTRCEPVFATFASTVVRLGPVGAGQVAKLLNNALFAANLAVAGDALALGAELGLDPEQLTRFIATGSGRSFGLEIALRARDSAETRQGAWPALEKDLQNLNRDVEDDRFRVLRAAAAEAVRRLKDQEGST